MAHAKRTLSTRYDSIVEFLVSIGDDQPEGYRFVAPYGSWNKLIYHSTDIKRLRKFVAEYSDGDFYFCPTSFSEPRRITENALRSRWSHCDCDEGDPFLYWIEPSIVMRTSPGRTQAMWRWNKPEDPTNIAAYNCAIVNEIKADSKDKSGWDVVKYLRVPRTRNYKYDNTPLVRIVADTDMEPIFDRPLIAPHKILRQTLRGNIDYDNLPFWEDVLAKYRHARIVSRNGSRRGVRGYLGSCDVGNRSTVVHAVACALAEQGVSPEEIASVLLYCKAFKSKWGDSQKDCDREVFAAIRKNREAA